MGMFQSAGRIWGFRNFLRADMSRLKFPVSIRRADLGLSELRSTVSAPSTKVFQSAGRIWGFRNDRAYLISFVVNSFNPPGGFGAFGT